MVKGFAKEFLLPEEFHEDSVAELFEKCDADGNGTLDLNENTNF